MTEDHTQDDIQDEPVTEDHETVVEEPQNEELTLEQKCQQYQDGWKRALADYENLRGQMAQEATRRRLSIKIDLIQALIPVIDNFDQAVHHTPDLSALDEETRKPIENWLSGVTYIQRQFEEALAALDCQPIHAKGETFDPHRHEALEETMEEGVADQEIVKEITRGWMCAEHVIRPAKVIVNKVQE